MRKAGSQVLTGEEAGGRGGEKRGGRRGKEVECQGREMARNRQERVNLVHREELGRKLNKEKGIRNHRRREVTRGERRRTGVEDSESHPGRLGGRAGVTVRGKSQARGIEDRQRVERQSCKVSVVVPSRKRERRRREWEEGEGEMRDLQTSTRYGKVNYLSNNDRSPVS